MARIIRITESTDPRLERFANLRSDAKRRFDHESFIVEGRWCLKRLIESPVETMAVLVEAGKGQEIAQWLPDSIPMYSLPTEQIRQLVGFNFHRGVLACGRRPPLRPIQQLVFDPKLPPVAIATLDISEKENLGSIMRTAAALGIENLMIGPKTVDPYSRRTIRVSMASLFEQKLFDLSDPQRQLAELSQERKIRTIVTTLQSDATPLDEFVADDRPCLLVVGNEAEGVDPAIEAVATDRVTIPMNLGADSLNVAVAAAIFMYRLTR